MDHTSLDLCLRINCLNSFFKTRKTIHAEEKDIFYSAVLKIIKHSKPELTGFICAYCDAEDIFVSLHGNAKNYIRSTTQDSAILTYFIMNTVHKDKRINRVQRTGLPFLNLRKYLVCDLADHFSWQLNSIKILELVVDVTCTHTTGI